MWISDPKDSNLGWFGGCGNLHCTGPENILIHDHTGDFYGSFIPEAVGKPSAAISNNELIGDALDYCHL